MKQLLVLLTAASLVIGGCVLGESDSSGTKEAKEITDLSMGGGVFVFSGQGYGLAQMGTFFDSMPYEDAVVYVNGIKLKNKSGLHSNDGPLSLDQLSPGKTARIVVYALGDSVVREIPIPETPIIVKPEDGVKATVGKELLVEIDFPGEHKYLSMTLTNQKNVAVGLETAEKKMTVKIPGDMLPNAGTSMLSAFSVQTLDDIPTDFDPNQEYSFFFVSTAAIRSVEFVATK